MGKEKSRINIVVIGQVDLAKFLSFLLIAALVGTSHATSPAEVYWRTALLNSPMPSAIRDLIYPGKAAVPTTNTNGVGSIFFLEKTLQPGSKMTLQFTRATSGATLLPPNSENKSIKKTLAECEGAPSLAGEAKTCATSLESMVDFAVSGLKSRNIRAMSTSISKNGSPNQLYTITNMNKVKASELVACHGQGNTYAIFHCHTTTASAYSVSLVGADGTKVQAFAACHMDAAAGVEEAYKKLNVKPGSVPVCHFLPQDDILWARV